MISSPSNERLKRLRRLRAKRRDRDDEGVFLVEGYREVKRAADEGVEIAELYVSPALFLGENERSLIESMAPGTTVHEVAPDAFATVAARDRPDGLLAVARQFDTSLDRQTVDGLVLVIEGVERPGNLGTMLRTAAGAGVAGVVVVDPKTDLFAPETVRSSVGTLFAQPVSVATADEAVAYLKGREAKIVTASPHGHVDHADVDMRGRVAIVVGSEQHGVTPVWLDAADTVARIPMAGVDSINVAAAAAVMLFEAIRQRKQAPR